MTITATSGAEIKTGTFELNFESPCDDKDLVTITKTTQSSLGSDDYSSNDLVFTYTPFLVEPSYCLLTV